MFPAACPLVRDNVAAQHALSQYSDVVHATADSVLLLRSASRGLVEIHCPQQPAKKVRISASTDRSYRRVALQVVSRPACLSVFDKPLRGARSGTARC